MLLLLLMMMMMLLLPMMMMMMMMCTCVVDTAQVLCSLSGHATVLPVDRGACPRLVSIAQVSP
jgi:hypothetical protein